MEKIIELFSDSFQKYINVFHVVFPFLGTPILYTEVKGVVRDIYHKVV